MSESNGIRRCANRCFFCFVDGLPEGLRRSLYVKDDDLLHSFLYGNFVTLTNLREADWERLSARRFSPLFVSVHTTDQELRRKMLGNPKAPDIVEQLNRLGQLRIQVHAQVVLCSGVNDGDYLAKTIGELASLYPTVQSLAVVPVGVTKHTVERKGSTVFRPSPAEAAGIIKRLSDFQRRFRGELGSGFVYSADELYLSAGILVPSASRYDGFPQLGNGIGVTRKFLEEWRYAKRKLQPSFYGRVAVVTGTLFAPILQRIVDHLNEAGRALFELVPVTNNFFGPSVTVAGLLSGCDVVAALHQRDKFDTVLLPRHMLDVDGERFLDGLTPADIARETGAKAVPARGPVEIVSSI